ncbi:MAG: hypothetical protein ACRDR6_08310 [Pseudonocardiaceae bacterium]
MPDVPDVVDRVVEPVVDALVGSVLAVPEADLITAVADPVPCCAVCSEVALREIVLVAWGELGPPRSARGVNPVLTVDECSTVVVSGWDVAWYVTAELTGVVVTGWLLTALLVVRTAMFVAVFTG